MPNQGDDMAAQDSSPTPLVKAEQHSQGLGKNKICQGFRVTSGLLCRSDPVSSAGSMVNAGVVS